MRFEKQEIPDKPIFLGTTQHAIRLERQVQLLVGFQFNQEFRQVQTVSVDSIEIGHLPKIGTQLPIAEITGTALTGYQAHFITTINDTEQAERDFDSDYQRLCQIKNIGTYQLLKIETEQTMYDLTYAPTITGDTLKQLREFLNLSQVAFAHQIGVVDKTVRRIENGEQKITNSLLNKMADNLPQLKTKFELQFDWISLTFPDLIAEQAILDVLKLNINLFAKNKTSLQHYSREYAFAGEYKLIVLDFAPKQDEQIGQMIQDTGTTVIMSGQGVRLFEKALLEQNKTWKQFFALVARYNGHPTRIDVAINDKLGLFNMDEVVGTVLKKQYWTKFRQPVLTGGQDTGWTVNFGKSPFVIKMYDKQKEQLSKGNEADILTRVELTYKDERADELLNEMLENDNLVPFVFDCLYTYIWLTDEPIPDDYYDKPRVREVIEQELKPMASWALFVALGKLMRFYREPKEQNIETIEKWLLKAVVPSLAIIKRTGRLNHILNAIDTVELRPEQEKLILATMTENMTRANAYLKGKNKAFDAQQQKYLENVRKENS
ncbi:replication initiation factor domain-containing protein [Leuconostoc citreum]